MWPKLLLHAGSADHIVAKQLVWMLCIVGGNFPLGYLPPMHLSGGRIPTLCCCCDRVVVWYTHFFQCKYDWNLCIRYSIQSVFKNWHGFISKLDVDLEAMHTFMAIPRSEYVNGLENLLIKFLNPQVELQPINILKQYAAVKHIH